MEQDFSIIPLFFFFEKFPVEKYIPFDLPLEQPVFPYKRKVPIALKL